MNESYYRGFLKETASLYNELLTAYLSGIAIFSRRRIECFQEQAGILPSGTVRIMLVPGTVEQQKREIRNETLTLRSFHPAHAYHHLHHHVGHILALNALNEETDTITMKLNGVKVDGGEDDFNRSMNELKTYLAKDIEIRNRDELGQLADRFNLMIRKFKITFDEIQDKYRMKGELGKAQEIQAAILPKGYPAVIR